MKIYFLAKQYFITTLSIKNHTHYVFHINTNRNLYSTPDGYFKVNMRWSILDFFRI